MSNSETSVARSETSTARSERGPNPTTVVLLFLTLCLIWGFTYVALKIGLRHAPPLTFTFSRALIGFFALGGYALATTRRFPTDAFTHRAAIALGLANVGAFWGLMNLGVARISAGESSILTYTQPIILVLLAWTFVGERPDARRLAGLALGFLGVIAVVADKVRPGSAADWLGYAFALGGGFFWAVGTLLFRRWQRRLDILWVTALQALYGSIPLALLAFAFERPSLDLSLDLGWTLAFTGLGSAGLAYLIWFYLLRHRDVAEVNSFVFLVPLFAVLFGAGVLGERLGPIALLGAALILGGIYVVGRRERS